MTPARKPPGRVLFNIAFCLWMALVFGAYLRGFESVIRLLLRAITG